MSKIVLNQITQQYGEKEVLNDFSFDFESNKTTCLLGPSGCGKTTLLRLIAGLEIPSIGSIVLNEMTVSENGKIVVPPHQRKIGFIFQDLALWPHFTVYDNIAFGLTIKKEKNINNRVSELLNFFGINDKARKYPHQLSGGQKQMVAIARSLVLQPEILLLDEPLANIDSHLKENIMEYLKSLQQQHRFTMLYVTHDKHEAMYTGDNILIINAGKVELAGSKEIIKKSTSQFAKSFLKI